MLHLFVDTFATPTGDMRAVTDENRVLRALEWVSHDNRLHKLLSRQYGAAKYHLEDHPEHAINIRQNINRYFDGDFNALDTLETKTNGTEFQQEVWAALRTIPVGKTASYAELSCMVGRPKAVRAVGLANGANPIGIVVPCHRVIGANGTLTGYGGGLDRKEWLLRHEGALTGELF